MTLPQALEQASDLVPDLVEAGRLRSEKDQLEYDVRETLLGLKRPVSTRRGCTSA
ncbi:hypothetical protein [Streptomyces sp. NPDC008122]|uniref:hypothetical protein n=1 Tax=Streptomyces sp. NPDC008122 TaxID=3364810 RepID=UPI0036EB468E